MKLRDYIDKLRIEGYSVARANEDDPVLIAPDGSAVDTWRENYPYDELMSREE
ncbi:MAG: polyphosphate kinase 2, partial [Microbacteriaceae bacterium]|nr:polyphosphate kinase 2 [Microbacteriaceae bacterium]